MNLPEEVIVKILSLLDNKDLKSCILLSRYFRELILTSPFLMSKIRVCFNDAKDHAEKLEFLEGFGLYVKNFHFNHSNFEHESDFIDILKLVPNIESLVFHNVRARNVDYEKLMEHELNFKKLKAADFNCSTHELLPFFMKCVVKKSPELKFFNIRCGMQTILYEDDIDILMQKEKLEVLIMDKVEFCDKISESTKHEPYKLKLKNFTLWLAKERTENFHDFLKSQAAHIKALSISYDNDIRCLDLVVKDFKHLEKLTIGCKSEIVEKISRDLRSHKMMSVKNLLIELYFNSTAAELETVLNLFPNIQALFLRDFSKNYKEYNYSEILQNFKHLSSIKFNHIQPSALNDLVMPNLKFLKITDRNFTENVLKCENFWENFFKNCPNLEKIIIKINWILPRVERPKPSEILAVLESVMEHQDLVKNFELLMFEVEPEYYEIKFDARKNAKIIEHFIGSEDTDFRTLYPNFVASYNDKQNPKVEYGMCKTIKWEKLTNPALELQ